MFRSLKLSHHKHTGKLKAQPSTSFLPLLILVAVAAFPLSFATASAQSWTRPGPEAESISLTGVVLGTPPSVGAVITTPADQFRSEVSNVIVGGTCPLDTLVVVYKNDMFAGSTACTASGAFSVEINLLIGENTITAKVFDALNQEGPPSNVITVFFDALPDQSTSLGRLDFGSAQMVIITDTYFRGIFPGDTLSVPISIIGGQPPYAVNVFWGDSTNDVVARNDSSAFDITHIYDRPGVYQLNIQATDTDGRVGFLSVAVIVNGAVTSGITSDGSSTNNALSIIISLWPVYLAIVAIVVGFFLGEVREKHALKRQGLIFNPPTPPKAS